MLFYVLGVGLDVAGGWCADVLMLMLCCLWLVYCDVWG